jgi:hypothetical protein
MSSIIRDGDTFHGISVDGRGVFSNHSYGRTTYAGLCKDGHACGLGVSTYTNGTRQYAEHGPDGKYDGRYLERDEDGDTYYVLCERGEPKEGALALVRADGTCNYNGFACAPDDPRLLALIAQVAPVEVRPAASAPPLPTRPPLAPLPPMNTWKQSSDGSAGSFGPPAGAGDRRGHRGARPRRRWWPCDTTQPHSCCQARPRSDADLP